MYIVHGTNDEVISYSHAEDLVRNCQEGIAYPPYLVENGGHNNLEAVWLSLEPTVEVCIGMRKVDISEVVL